ncbi:MAG: hypothetical protein K6F55_02280, partial [Eubacterium sp.]|nr:hypothetical protein [Eubacterium sp.]
ALYLDGDIVVSDDLTELYNKNIDDYVVAAVPDSSVMYMPRDEMYLKDYYFNSGVMLMNLRKMREEKTSEKLREMKRSLSDKSLMDQNVFNLVIKDRVERLPIKYNFMYVNLNRSKDKWSFEKINLKYKTDYRNLKEIEKDAVIVHYASKDKPWKMTDIVGFDIWFDCFSKFIDNLINSSVSPSVFHESMRLYKKLEEKRLENIRKELCNAWNDQNNIKSKLIKSEKERKKLLDSKSWKVTRPMREIGKLVKK